MASQASDLGRIRIVLADDHPAYIAGVQTLLSTERWAEVVGVAQTSTDLVELLGRVTCDVLVTDFSMPGGRYGDGLTLLGFLARRFSHVHLVVLTGSTSVDVLHNLTRLDVDGLISKMDGTEGLLSAIIGAKQGLRTYSATVLALLAGGGARSDRAVSSKLTKRESEVFRLFAEGHTIIQIAEILARSTKTISTQKKAAMRKLELASDAELFAFAARQGLVTSAGSAQAELAASASRKED